tara:strand:+ start:24 stop:341 length:318 start_codon:yes stop_codon:yes gene_type:complete
MSSQDNNGNGHKIRASLAALRIELTAKYPRLPIENQNVAIDCISWVLNTFTVEGRNQMKGLQLQMDAVKRKQARTTATIKYVGTVLVTLLCGAGALIFEKALKWN